MPPRSQISQLFSARCFGASGEAEYIPGYFRQLSLGLVPQGKSFTTALHGERYY